jgi:hypothetical protein
MTRSPDDPRDWTGGVPVLGGILTAAVRRDLADLNGQYLELGLDPQEGADPLLAWSEVVRQEIGRADPAVRGRMAACPFALFEIGLQGVRGKGRESVCVEDRPQDDARVFARPPRCVEFTHAALFTAWRLADAAPLAARIAFGLSPAAELALIGFCPSQVAGLATHPGVVRARWPAQPGFWAMLRSAAQANCVHALQWAHCSGICLMDADHGGARAEDVVPAPGPQR